MNGDYNEVRNMLVNLAMDELWKDTRKLVDKFGYTGARIYLSAQYQAVSDLEEVLETEDDLNGDEL